MWAKGPLKMTRTPADGRRRGPQGVGVPMNTHCTRDVG
jgi:hypothetical protein